MAENSNKQNALTAARPSQSQKPAAQPVNNNTSPNAGPRKPIKNNEIFPEVPRKI